MLLDIDTKVLSLANQTWLKDGGKLHGPRNMRTLVSRNLFDVNWFFPPTGSGVSSNRLEFPGDMIQQSLWLRIQSRSVLI